MNYHQYFKKNQIAPKAISLLKMQDLSGTSVHIIKLQIQYILQLFYILEIYVQNNHF